MKSLIDELKARGFIAQMSETGLEEALEKGEISVYVGFDPSAKSLHLGHMIPLLMLAHFQRYGHRVIPVVGGGTGMIGDPSGKSSERVLLSEEILAENVAAIKKQIARFLDFEGENPAILVDNGEWLNQLNLITFLREIGKYFSVNVMMAKDSIRTRLEERDQGISYTEFSYMLLQSLDYLELYDRYGCTLQMGGSDQWGNITSGIDLIRRLRGGSAHALTAPLLTKADGTKFGKSEGGAVWLDAEMTSPYELFQYWLNVDDRDVIRFLKLFTFLTLEEIATFEAELQSQPELRNGQRRLALEFTGLVHGAEIAAECDRASRFLFGGNIDELQASTLDFLQSIIPCQSLLRAELQAGLSVEDAFVNLGLVKSKSEVKRMVKGGGIYLNNAKISEGQSITPQDLIHDRGVFLRVGKKNYGLLLAE